VYLLQALLSLALVVALIYGAYWLLRRSGMGGRDARTTRGGPAEVVQSLPLHGAYVLHVVKLAGKLLAVTCGPGGVAIKELGAAGETPAPRDDEEQ
jgi:flagellar biogenesis protein FliO